MKKNKKISLIALQKRLNKRLLKRDQQHKSKKMCPIVISPAKAKADIELMRYIMEGRNLVANKKHKAKQQRRARNQL